MGIEETKKIVKIGHRISVVLGLLICISLFLFIRTDFPDAIYGPLFLSAAIGATIYAFVFFLVAVSFLEKYVTNDEFEDQIGGQKITTHYRKSEDGELNEYIALYVTCRHVGWPAMGLIIVLAILASVM